MSNKHSKAYKWAQERSTVQTYCAVLRFKIPKKFWDDKKTGIKLSFENESDMQTWNKIIRFNRSGEREHREIETLIDGVPFILGPVSYDGSWDDPENKKDPNWPYPQEKGWNQLCICNKSVGKEFNMYLDKIAFIAIKEKPAPNKKK